MLNSTLTGLKELMSAQGVAEDAITRVIEQLEPFRVRVNSGAFLLAEGGVVDGSDVRRDIASVMETPVRAMDIISWRGLELQAPLQPNEKPGEYRLQLSRLIKFDPEANFRRFFLGRWKRTFDDAVRDKMKLLKEIEQALQCARFNSPLKDCLYASYGREIGDILHKEIWSCLLYYVTFAILGKMEPMNAVERILSRLTAAAPLAQKQGEPSTWLVLVA